MSYKIDLKSSLMCVKSLSVKIDTLASDGMSIFMPEMPVITVLSQSICIILKATPTGVNANFFFGICQDNLINVG